MKPGVSDISLADRVSALENRFTAREPSVHAFIPEAGRFERLRREAEALEDRLSNPTTDLSLLGVFVGGKDIFRVDGFATQAGSRLPPAEFEGQEAESVTRLKQEGALIVGKTVTTEFAYFTPGPTRNPHNLEHTPGGSSSGSAAAIAAGMCSLALGTQTIGSIIRPAAFCGVIGFKPTYERIPRAGVIPLSPSLDHVGFFASDMQTAVRASRVLISGFIPWRGHQGPVLGIPDGPYLACASKEGRRHFDRVCERLSPQYSIRHVSVMPDFQEVQSRHSIILAAEAARVHAEWFARYPDLYSAKFAELVRRGQRVVDSELDDALRARERFRSVLISSMNQHEIDLWICPSALGAAPRGLESTGDPVMSLPWTQAGLPAINLPAGKNEDGLPLGVQLVAGWNRDEALLSWADDMLKGLEPV